MRITGGNVGIGTTSPDERLTLPYNQYIGWEYSSGNSTVGHKIGKSSNGAGPLEFVTSFNPGPTGRIFSFIQDNGGPFEHLSILYNGNVGIGTASPGAKLDIKDTNAGIFLTGSDGNTNVALRNNGEDFEVVEIEDTGSSPQSSLGGHAWLTIKDGGKVSIGTIPLSSNAQLQVEASGSGSIGVFGTGASQGVRGFSSSSFGLFGISDSGTGVFGHCSTGIGGGFRGAENDGTKAAVTIETAFGPQTMLLDGNEIDALATGLYLNHNSSENVMLATGGGRVGIGTTSPNFRLHVNGSAGKPGGGSWSSASDRRLKDVQGYFTRGLAAIDQLTPVYYTYKNGNPINLPSDQEHVGLLAQEVAKVIPEAVGEYDSNYLSVNNDAIIWTMLNAIKELKAENEAMKARITQLEDGQ